MVDPQMFLLMKKRLYGPFSWMGFNSTDEPQGYNENHFEEAIYFLFTIKFLPEIAGTHFLSTSVTNNTILIQRKKKNHS